MTSPPLYTAFEADRELHVPFSSASDALLAELCLQHNVPSDIFNLVINTIHHPDFKLDEVSLASSRDVDRLAADFHCRLALERSVGDASTTFPFVIFQNVLDIISASRDEALKLGFFRPKDTNCLLSLSLVHRSWTTPCQQLLGRYVAVRTMQQLKRISLSPVVGTWTRLLLLHAEYREFVAPEITYSLSHLLARVPNLTTLDLAKIPAIDDPQVILDALSQLTMVSSLTWRFGIDNPRDFDFWNASLVQFCQAIQHLCFLESLTLLGWGCGEWDNDHPSALMSLCAGPPSFQLQKLNLSWVIEEMTPACLAWLLCPPDANSRPVRSFSFRIKFIGRYETSNASKFVSEVFSVLAGINTLELQLEGFIDEVIIIFLQACQHLEKLTLCGHTHNYESLLEKLPGSVVNLSITLSAYGCREWKGMEKMLVRFIEHHNGGVSNLGQLSISLDSSYAGMLQNIDDLPSTLLGVTCKSRGIVFQVTQMQREVRHDLDDWKT